MTVIGIISAILVFSREILGLLGFVGLLGHHVGVVVQEFDERGVFALR